VIKRAALGFSHRRINENQVVGMLNAFAHLAHDMRLSNLSIYLIGGISVHAFAFPISCMLR